MESENRRCENLEMHTKTETWLKIPPGHNHGATSRTGSSGIHLSCPTSVNIIFYITAFRVARCMVVKFRSQESVPFCFVSLGCRKPGSKWSAIVGWTCVQYSKAIHLCGAPCQFRTWINKGQKCVHTYWKPSLGKIDGNRVYNIVRDNPSQGQHREEKIGREERKHKVQTAD